jgi:glycosyltransferase involved in cell wall biosynthesis
MRIAVWHNLPSGGGKRALGYHVRGLAQRGHHIEVWSPPTADLAFLPLAPWAAEHVVAFDVPPLREKRPILRFFARHAQRLRALEAFEKHSRECAQQIQRKGFDLLFANSSLLPLAVGPIGRLTELPALLYLQEPSRDAFDWERNFLIPDAFVNGPWPHPPLKLYLDELARAQVSRLVIREELRNAASYQEVLVNSHFSSELTTRLYARETQVCYLGIDTTLFRNLDRQREDLIVGLGRLSLAKNAAFVVEAVAKLPQPRPRLIWIGDTDSPERLRLEGLASRLGVTLEIKIRVSDGELIETLNKALLLAYAPRLEPFGFAPLEANACGTPVVAVGEAGVRETVLHEVNGLLVDRDPASMAEAIARLRKEPPLARELGMQGWELVRKKWSLEQAVDRVEGHLLQVARAHIPVRPTVMK